MAAYVTFQMAEVAVLRWMFAEILMLIARLRAPPASARRVWRSNASGVERRGRPCTGRQSVSPRPRGHSTALTAFRGPGERSYLAENAQRGDHHLATAGHRGNVG
jgi:hypothetical protein